MIKDKYTIKDFLPLIIIFLIILCASILTPAYLNEGWMLGMRVFMGGFFVIFGLLKLINLKKFVLDITLTLRLQILLV